MIRVIYLSCSIISGGGESRLAIIYFVVQLLSPHGPPISPISPFLRNHPHVAKGKDRDRIIEAGKVEQRTERTLGRRIAPAASGLVPGVSYAKIAKEKKTAPTVPPTAPPPPPPPRPIQKKTPESTPKKTSGKQGKNDSPISPPPREKKGTEVTVAPVIIPVTRASPRKDKKEHPKDQKEERKYAKEEVEKSIGSARKKAIERKDPMMAGTFTETSNKRKAGESLEKEEKNEAKTRKEETRARSRSKSRKTEETTPQEEETN